MDFSFLIAVGAVLCLLSGLIAVRMGSAGATPRQIAPPVVELWLVLALWVAIFYGLGAALRTPAGGSPWEELSDLGARLGALSGPVKWWGAAGVVVALAACWHLFGSLRRAMGAHLQS